MGREARACSLVPFTPLLVVPREHLHQHFFGVSDDNGDEGRREHDDVDAFLDKSYSFLCFLLFF